MGSPLLGRMTTMGSTYGEALTRATERRGERMNQDILQRGVEDQDAMRAAMPGAVAGDPAAMTEVLRRDPATGLKVMDHAREQQAQALQRMQQATMASAGAVIMAEPEQRPGVYDQARRTLQGMFPGKFNDLPEQYDDKSFLAQVAPMFPPEVMEKIVAERFKPTAPQEAPPLEKVDAGDRVELYDRSGKLVRTVSKGATPAEGPKPSDVAGARKEFTGLTKDFQVVQDSYNRIQQVTKKPTPAGDLALLYNYVKLLDPGSVVRESEFAVAATAGSYGDRVQAAAQRILSGERLSDDMREDFKGRATDLFTAQKNSYSQIKKQYRAIAERGGMNPDDVTPDLETPQAPEAPAQGAAGEIKFLGFEEGK